MLWDGITRAETLHEGAVKIRHAAADAARDYDWPRLLELITEHPALINASRPGGSSRYAPLHQAAHGGAPIEVVERLLERSAWRTLREARGEIARDIAARQGHEHLLQVLTPVLRREVPRERLAALQMHLHALVRGRAEVMVTQHALRLPELEPLLEMDEPAMWFPVPGMYGGFSFTLVGAGEAAILVCESWSRVVGGSGQRHEIDAQGIRLVEKGFV